MNGKQWVLLTAFISGFSIYVNKFFVSSFNAFQFSTLKNVAVALMLVAAIGFTRKFDEIKKLSRRDLLWLVVVGITGGSVPFLLFFYGLQLTSAASAAFIHKTMFIFASAFAFIFLKERVSRRQLISGLVLFAGVSLIYNLAGISFSIFDVVILAATVLWALEATISKRLLKNISPSTVALGRMGFGAVFMLAFLFASGNASLQMDIWNVIPLAVTSIFLFGYVFTWYHGLQKISVNSAATILMLGSVVTTMLQINVSIPIVIGAILVSAAVAMNSSAVETEAGV